MSLVIMVFGVCWLNGLQRNGMRFLLGNEAANKVELKQLNQTTSCVDAEIASVLTEPQKIIDVIGTSLIISNGWAVNAHNPWSHLVSGEIFESALPHFKGKTVHLKLAQSYAFGGISVPFHDTPYDQIPRICGEIAGSPIPVNLTEPNDWNDVFDAIAVRSIVPSPHRLDCEGEDREFCTIAATHHSKLEDNGCLAPGYFGGAQVLDAEKCWQSVSTQIHGNCKSNFPPAAKVKVAIGVILRNSGRAWITTRIGEIESLCDR